MDVAFGHWLAGFFDGEGSFGVYPGYGPRHGGFRCCAKISLRLDDKPILAEIVRQTGVGRLYYDKKGRVARKPCVAWIVEGREACLRLVEIFEAYPLRAKKRVDFEIWARAVREWTSLPSNTRRDWSSMAALHAELRAARAFT